MDKCPAYWDVLDNLAQRGVIFSPLEVKHEIDKKDDDLADWIRSRSYLFRNVTDDVQKNMRIIMARYPRLVDSRKSRSLADPWVIAHAMAENSVVVTRETPAGISAKTVKIPDVYVALRIQWMNDLQFLDEVGVKFSARLKED